MIRLLPAPVRGVLATFALVLNTLFWCWFLFVASLLKVLLPWTAARRRLRDFMHWVARQWIAGNSAWMAASALLMSASVSMPCLLNGRLPMLKFFLKQVLIWVPVIGLCWWALEFPFMKRYTRAYLEKHPEKRGQDLATTRVACERYKTNPVCVFNFLEGTRFTPAKHAAQGSPFRHLLKPRAGGIAFVLDAMGEQLAGLVDVTVYYPGGRTTYWDLACGRVPRIVVRVRPREIPAQFLGRSYEEDAAYRAEFQQWVNTLWQEKDALLEQLRAG